MTRKFAIYQQYATEYGWMLNSKKMCGFASYDVSGENSHTAQLTWEQVRTIRRKLKNKESTGTALAQRYGVSRATISMIANNKRWIE